MSGSTRVEQFEECTGVELPEGDWQTVAGYVIDAFDDIPSEGDRVLTDIGEFEVLTMDGFAIDALRVRMTVVGQPSGLTTAMAYPRRLLNDHETRHGRPAPALVVPGGADDRRSSHRSSRRWRRW